MSARPLSQNVFTIPAGVPFVDALAAGLIARAGGDALALSRMTVLLPNRRACRALAEAFLRQAGVDGAILSPSPAFGGGAAWRGDGMLLPRLRPIGEPDEEDLAVAEAAVSDAEGAEIAPAIGELRRRMLLAQLIHGSPQARLGDGGEPMRFDQAVRLAAELARLIDQVATERLDFARVRDLAPADSVYWQMTVRFLDLVQANWPRILEGEGALDPATRRNLLLARQCARWREAPPAGPVIAAGSTGSIPASADLIALVAQLPQGMVVLPGLDREIDREAAEAIAADQSHPQYGLHHLLTRLEVAPENVALWPCDGFAAAPSGRAAVVSHALLPAGETARWGVLAAMLDQEQRRLAWREVMRVDCASEQEEAGVIALILRAAAEKPAPHRAALVTPDRGLARRVKAELARWGIAIDDSAGESLRMSAPGAFLTLIAEAAARDWAPVPLLSLLKHPLAAAARPLDEFRRKVRLLERSVLRGPRPAPGLDGLRARIETLREQATEDWQRERLQRLANFVAKLERLAASFIGLAGAQSVATRLSAHVRLAEALAATDAETGIARLWRGEAGEAAADFVQDLIDAARDAPPLELQDYAALLPELMESVAVRPRYGLHPRLFIWGPLEARLQQADLVVLGGLNEGTWPAEAPVDPWLSRPMRAEFGLPSPERRIGLSAHDFQQAMGAPQVVLTRAIRAAGQPTIPSRWLLRLEAYLQLLGIGQNAADLMQGQAATWRGWRQLLDRAEMVQPIARPAPRPGPKLRPASLSVTQVEAWMRDPYAVYARHILKLKPLDPLDQDPDLSDLGTIVHAALHRFVSAFPGELPADAIERLLVIGAGEFAPFHDRPAVMAFWWPRFEKIARWFIATEAERRPLLVTSHTELEGKLLIDDVKPHFTLNARADRFDRLADGALVVIDYKTGMPPTPKEVRLGFAPQLPLEAAIARDGEFKGLARAAVARLEYWRLSGGATPGEIKDVCAGSRAVAAADANDLARDAHQGLVALLRAFAKEGASYPPVPRAEYAPRYNDYDHLERIGEWSVNQTDEDAGEYG